MRTPLKCFAHNVPLYRAVEVAKRQPVAYVLYIADNYPIHYSVFNQKIPCIAIRFVFKDGKPLS